MMMMMKVLVIIDDDDNDFDDDDDDDDNRPLCPKSGSQSFQPQSSRIRDSCRSKTENPERWGKAYLSFKFNSKGFEYNIYMYGSYIYKVNIFTLSKYIRKSKNPHNLLHMYDLRSSWPPIAQSSHLPYLLHQCSPIGSAFPLDPGGEWPGHIPGQVRLVPGAGRAKQGGLPNPPPDPASFLATTNPPDPPPSPTTRPWRPTRSSGEAEGATTTKRHHHPPQDPASFLADTSPQIRSINMIPSFSCPEMDFPFALSKCTFSPYFQHWRLVILHRHNHKT